MKVFPGDFGDNLGGDSGDTRKTLSGQGGTGRLVTRGYGGFRWPKRPCGAHLPRPVMMGTLVIVRLGILAIPGHHFASNTARYSFPW